MTTKEWFSRGRRLDRRIKHLLQQRREEWDRVTSVTANLSGEVVDGTKDPHKLDHYAELDDMIGQEINELCRVKCELKAVIMQISDLRYRDVLDKRYVDSKSWELIAVEMNFDYYYVKGALHGKALAAASEFIKKEDLDGSRSED